ncbi:MAG TPA: S1 RNA-binding domain-containing protein, partial [Actinobacteria bacterium]|nr:S1 RNA-binding domain-containing protein [Actinomycetota bacterium]
MTNEHESAFAQDPTITETSATAVAEETVSEPIEARAEVVETPEAPADVEAEAPVEAPATEPDAEAVTVETPEAPADVEAEAPVEAPATEPDAEAVTVETPEAPADEEGHVAEPVETPVQAVAEPESKKIVIPAERPAIVAKDVSDLPDDLDFGAAIEATVLEFDEGDIVEGTVASIDQDGVLVDVGYKSEGLIPLRELSIRRGIDP